MIRSSSHSAQTAHRGAVQVAQCGHKPAQTGAMKFRLLSDVTFVIRTTVVHVSLLIITQINIRYTARHLAAQMITICAEVYLAGL